MPCENTVNPLLILYDIDSDWLCVAFQLPVGAVSLFGSSPPPLLISKKTEDEEVRVTWTVQYLVSRGFFLAWLLGFMESFGRQSPIWPRFFFGKYLTIIGRVWTKYGDLSVVSRSIIIIYLLICETLTNHVIFGYPSSIIVSHSITKFVFEWISSGSEAICHFSRKSDRKTHDTVGRHCA